MKRLLLVLTVAALGTPVAVAQSPAPDEPTIRAGLRAGVASIGNEAFDEIYGTTLPLFGADAGVAVGRLWSVRGALEWGRASGELVVPLPDAVPSGFGADFRALIAHLTLTRAFPLTRDWVIRGGAGISWLGWEEETEFASNSGSGAGVNAIAEVAHVRRAWEVTAALSWWSVPDVLADGGLAAVREDRSLAGPQLSVGFARRF